MRDDQILTVSILVSCFILFLSLFPTFSASLFRNFTSRGNQKSCDVETSHFNEIAAFARCYFSWWKTPVGFDEKERRFAWILIPPKVHILCALTNRMPYWWAEYVLKLVYGRTASMTAYLTGRGHVMDRYFSKSLLSRTVEYRQYILIGCQYTSCAYRFAEERRRASHEKGKAVTVYEVENESKLKQKVANLKSGLNDEEWKWCMEGVHFVPFDVEAPMSDANILSIKMFDVGFQPDLPSVVICECVGIVWLSNLLETIRNLREPEKTQLPKNKG